MGSEKMVDAKESDRELQQSIQLIVTKNKEDLESSIAFKTCPIYKVPERFRKLNEGAYTPRVVAIGPIHRDAEHVQGMENVKGKYMIRLIKREREGESKAEDGTKGEEESKGEADADVRKTIDKCSIAILKMAQDAKDCYPQTVTKNYSDKEFTQMMIVDGCFILEVIFSLTREYNDDIPMLGDIKYDLVLLENQIPLFVLSKLHELLIENLKHPSPPLLFNESVLKFFSNDFSYTVQYPPMPLNAVLEEEEGARVGRMLDDVPIDHILALIHRCYKVNRSNLRAYKPATMKKYTATELKSSGIHIKPGQISSLLVEFKTTCLYVELLDFVSKIIRGGRSITHRRQLEDKCCFFFLFCRLIGSATLEIPRLPLNGLTESFFRNLMAYEQCSILSSDVTAFAFLMATLIDSKKDVELLENSEVLDCHVGTNEDAYLLFNGLCREALHGDVYFFENWDKLDKYCQRRWIRDLASLRTNYFNSPWTIISVIGALLLFALTAIQTAYTILSVVHPT